MNQSINRFSRIKPSLSKILLWANNEFIKSDRKEISCNSFMLFKQYIAVIIACRCVSKSYTT